MTPCGALRASSLSPTAVTTSNIWSRILLFHFFCALAVVTRFAPIRFYKQTTLRTETFTQSSFYAQIFLHREVCAQKNIVRRRFYTQRFLRKEGIIYTDVLYKDAFARKNKNILAFLHAEPLPQRSLCTEQSLHFTHVFSTQENVWHRETCTQRLHTKVFTNRFFYTQKLYPEQFLHSIIFFRTETFTHKNSYAQQFLQTYGFYSAQKSYAQKVLRTTFFTYRRFYTQMPLHRHKLHTETCAHSTRLTQSTFTRRGFASPSWSPTFRVPPLK